MKAKYNHFETLQLHAGNVVDQTNARATPIHRTTSYLFNSTEHAANLFGLKELGNIYTRLQNPTHDVLEQRLAALEGGAAALALSSGTSAIFYTIINICGKGDEVVSSKYLYGGTYTQFNNILPELGIEVKFAESLEPEAFERLITDSTRVLFTEIIGNPTLDVVNLQGLAKLSQKYNLPLVVDSTFTPPCLFRPIEHGAHVVVHSLTKWIGGHGTAIGGIAIDSGTFNWTDKKFRLYNEPDTSYHGLRYAHDLGPLNPVAFALRLRLVPLRNLGACISPDNAWAILQGIETLSLRMERHSSNAQRVAEFLKGHKEVAWVRYPGLAGDPSHEVASKQMKNGFGGMVVFGIKGDSQRGAKFINSLQLFSHLANVGDAKSLAIHPASTTHSQLSAEQMALSGISPDLVRLSVGIENVNDIIADIEQAIG